MFIAWDLFTANFGWMGWNLFLAFIPLALSLILFNHNQRSYKDWRNLLWWLGFLIFVLFLPNAPYIATDVIHLINDLREPEISRTGLLFLIIPQYVFFLVAGFECYVMSLINLYTYLQSRNTINQAIWLELAINFVCAVGVYLGRFNRLNSWNIVTKPIRLARAVTDNLDSYHFVIFTLLFFIVITTLYYLFKGASIAIFKLNQD